MLGFFVFLFIFVCMWIFKKKVNVLWLILGLFVVGILGYWFGILGFLLVGYLLFG